MSRVILSRFSAAWFFFLVFVHRPVCLIFPGLASRTNKSTDCTNRREHEACVLQRRGLKPFRFRLCSQLVSLFDDVMACERSMSSLTVSIADSQRHSILKIDCHWKRVRVFLKVENFQILICRTNPKGMTTQMGALDECILIVFVLFLKRAHFLVFS